MPYTLRAFRILLPLTLIVVGVLWLLGQEREVTIAIQPFSANEQAVRSIVQAEISDQQNLTKRVAKEIAEELLEKNKDGPQESSDGLTVILNPAETLREMMNSVNASKFAPFEGIAPDELNFARSDTSEARREYFKNIGGVMERAFSRVAGMNILDALTEALAKNNASLNAMIASHEDAISALKKMPVPASLAALHKKEIDLLMKTSVMLKGMSLVSVDPLRAYLALQIYPKLVEEAQTLEQEFSVAITKERISSIILSLVAGKPAYAAVPTFELNRLLLAIFPRDQFEYLNRILTEFLKGNLLNYLKDLVLNFVKGDGTACSLVTYFAPGGRTLCPKFVLNWEKALFGAKAAAEARLEREIQQSRIPEPNKQLFSRLLDRDSTSGYGASFDSLTRNVESCRGSADPVADLLCATDFNNSVELQFLAYLKRKEELQEKYEEGRKAELIANQGFESTKKCVDEALDADTGQPVCLQWVTTKPGSITQEITAKTATVDWDRIVNAFDLQALLGALASLFMNQLLQSGIEGILGLIESGILPPPPGIYPSPPPLPDSPTPTPSPGSPIALQISADPIVIDGPGSATLTWNSAGAVSCSASGGWSGPKTTSGRETIFLLSTTAYSITCANEFGQSETRSVTVVVSLLSQISINFNASPMIIRAGESAILDWNANVSPGPTFTCEASGAWAGAKPLSGTETVSPRANATYALTCRSIVGDAGTQSVTITVQGQ